MVWRLSEVRDCARWAGLAAIALSGCTEWLGFHEYAVCDSGPACEGGSGAGGAGGGEVLWSKQFHATHGATESIAVDGEGNVVLTGYFSGTLNFGGETYTSKGDHDIFVAKLSPGGEHLWLEQFGDVSKQVGRAIAVDDAGNVFVTGSFGGSMDFDDSCDDITAQGTTADIFVFKLDKDGVCVWSQSYGGSGEDLGERVTVDGNGDVVLIGDFMDSMNVGVNTLGTKGGRDVFVAKIDASNADAVGGVSFGSSADNERGYGIATDGDGNVVLAGVFRGATSLGGDELPFVQDNDIGVAKLHAVDPPSHDWSKAFGGPKSQACTSIAVDGSGNVVLTGGFNGSIDFGNSKFGNQDKEDFDVFVAKLDVNGNHLWSWPFGDEQDQIGHGTAVDKTGNVVLAGAFEGSMDFGAMLTSEGDKDIFVAKLDPSSGKPLWSKQFGDAARQWATAVAVDHEGHVLLTGTFFGSADFDGDVLETSNCQTVNDKEGCDIFVAKLAP